MDFTTKIFFSLANKIDDDGINYQLKGICQMRINSAVKEITPPLLSARFKIEALLAKSSLTIPDTINLFAQYTKLCASTDINTLTPYLETIFSRLTNIFLSLDEASLTALFENQKATDSVKDVLNRFIKLPNTNSEKLEPLKRALEKSQNIAEPLKPLLNEIYLNHQTTDSIISPFNQFNIPAKGIDGTFVVLDPKMPGRSACMTISVCTAIAMLKGLITKPEDLTESMLYGIHYYQFITQVSNIDYGAYLSSENLELLNLINFEGKLHTDIDVFERSMQISNTDATLSWEEKLLWITQKRSNPNEAIATVVLKGNYAFTVMIDSENSVSITDSHPQSAFLKKFRTIKDACTFLNLYYPYQAPEKADLAADASNQIEFIPITLLPDGEPYSDEATAYVSACLEQEKLTDEAIRNCRKTIIEFRTIDFFCYLRQETTELNLPKRPAYEQLVKYGKDSDQAAEILAYLTPPSDEDKILFAKDQLNRLFGSTPFPPTALKEFIKPSSLGNDPEFAPKRDKK